MAFNTAPGRAEYTASAAQTKFTFTFKIFNTSDVKVYLTPAGQTADDTADILIETTDYTVSINGDNGGDVTLTSGATLNDSITLVRSLPITRGTEYQHAGDLTAAALNSDQEYQTYLTLDASVEFERVLKIPSSVQGFDVVLPSPEANKMFIYNQDGTAIDLIDPASTSFFKDAFIVDTMAAILAVDKNVYGSVNVRGYHTQNDGGGDLFNWDSAINKSTANAGTIIDPDETLANQGSGVGFGCWVRQYSGAVNAKWFNPQTSQDLNDIFSSFKEVIIDIDFVADSTVVVADNIIKGKGSIKASSSFSGDKKTYTYSGTTYDNYPLVYSLSSTSLSITGIELSCENNGMTADASSCILLDNCNNTILDNCEIHHNYQTASNGTVNGGAIFIVGGDSNSTHACYLHDIGGEGIHSRSDNTKVTDSTFDTSTSSLIGSQRYGPTTSREATGLIASGNNLKNSTNSAISCNHNYSTINGNIIEDCGIGIILGHRTTFAKRTGASFSTCTGNTIKNIQEYGIRHAYGDQVTISGNTVDNFNLSGSDDPSNSGIGSGSWAGSATITGNTVSNGYRGIYVTGNASDVDETINSTFVVSDNIVTDIETYAVRVDSANGFIATGNIIKRFSAISSSTQAGIGMFGDKANCSNLDVLISGNIIGEIGATETGGIRVSPTGTGDDIKWNICNNQINTSSSIIITTSELTFVKTDNNKTIDLRGTGGLLSIGAGASSIDMGVRIAGFLNNSSAQTVTDITSEIEIGQQLTIVSVNANSTFTSTGNMTLQSDYAMADRDILVLVRYSSTEYVEVSRT